MAAGQIAPLGVHITVTSIHDIDTAAERATICFDVDMFIQASPNSKGPKMDCGSIPTNREEAVAELKNIFAESFCVAQIECRAEEMTTDDWGEGILPDVYGGEVKYTVTQKVAMDLSSFPFDVQTVPLRFYQQYDRAYRFVSPAQFWEEDCSSLYATHLSTVPSALISEEWELHPPLLSQEETSPEETMSTYSTMTIHLKVARKGKGYAVRFMTLMAALSLCGILPLLVRPTMSAGDMLGFEIGLLFAVVAFQLLVSTFLPVTSTATALDQYAFFLFGFIFACMVTITAASFASNNAQFSHSEIHAAWLFGLWFLFHIYYASFVHSLFRKRDTNLRECGLLSHKTNAAFVIANGNSVAVVSQTKLD